MGIEGGGRAGRGRTEYVAVGNRVCKSVLGSGGVMKWRRREMRLTVDKLCRMVDDKERAALYGVSQGD